MSLNTDTAAIESIQTPTQKLIADFCQSWVAIGALIVFLVIVAMALLAPWITPQDPYDLRQLSVLDSLLPPSSVGMGGVVHWLGTDDQGRDLFSAIVYGLRTSLFVGAASAFIALWVGTVAGLTAAWTGGRVDTLLMRLVDIQMSFPATLIALILLAVLGKGVDKIILALVVVQWAYYARTVRGVALVEQRKEYIEAGICLALPTSRLLFRHLLRNCMPPLIVLVTVQVASAITLEATLSFLGLGLPVTEPSLGLLIANGYDYMLGGRYWITVFPGCALVLTVITINLVGDQLRDVLNPNLQA